MVDKANEPVKPGHIKIVKLAQEGTLQKGDTVQTTGLGKCVVAFIRSVDSICVKRIDDGSYHTLQGIGWTDRAVLRQAA